MELQTCIHTHTPGEYLEVRGKSTLYCCIFYHFINSIKKIIQS